MRFAIAMLVSSFFFGGCASSGLKGTYAEKLQVGGSLESIVKAFDRATMGVRGRSTNGREIVSRYQSVKGDAYDDASAKKNRAYARMLILGDRRPYDLQVQFVIEGDGGGGDYQVQSYDDERARKILKKILDTLAARPGSKDFIDDFRSF